MRAQASSLPFTPIFAALTAIVNTKLPTIGELLITRLIVQFRRSYKRNDKVGLFLCGAGAVERFGRGRDRVTRSASRDRKDVGGKAQPHGRDADQPMISHSRP